MIVSESSTVHGVTHRFISIARVVWMVFSYAVPSFAMLALFMILHASLAR